MYLCHMGVLTIKEMLEKTLMSFLSVLILLDFCYVIDKSTLEQRNTINRH